MCDVQDIFHVNTGQRVGEIVKNLAVRVMDLLLEGCILCNELPENTQAKTLCKPA